MNRPNILFVFSDQHRWCDMSCYGNKYVKTPNFDRFSEIAVKVNNCISNSPVCVPARGSLLTGLFPQKHGAFTNDLEIDFSLTGIADILNNNGYDTGYIGKWHLCGIPRDQFIDEKRRLGFKTWKVANCNHSYLNCYYDDENNNRNVVKGYEPEIFGDLAADFLKSHDKTEPWALYLSFATPHDPYLEIGKEYYDMYKDESLELRENATDLVMRSKSNYINHEQMTENLKGYYGHISAIDKQFGNLLNILEETDRLDNTIIVYTSDHGDMFGSHGVTDKQSPYEESIHVPLLLYWKGHTIKGATDELIGLVDLPTSLLGMIGLKFPDKVSGKDIHEIFTSKDGKGLDECYIFDLYPCHQAYDKGYSAWRGIRSKQFTFVLNIDDNYNNKVLLLDNILFDNILFDNINDPFQMNNVADNIEYKKIKDDLMIILHKYINENDKLLSGDDYIRYSGKLEEFNKSQRYFRGIEIAP